MKKLFLVIVVFLVLIGNVGYKSNFTLLDYFSGEYYVFTSNKQGVDSVFLGSCYMSSTPLETSDEIIGESMKIYNFEPVSALQSLNATIIFSECLDSGASVIYAYTDKIKKFVQVNGKKVNIQLAHYDEYSIIGWPLILGSF